MSASQLCSVLVTERPVLLAPMAKIASGRLAKAVTDAGGLGVLGGGYGDLEWIDREMEIVGDTPVGIGLITWNMAAGALDVVLERHRPKVVWMSFGDPCPHLPMIAEAGAVSICQVGTVGEAVAAVDAGADVIVAQGSEAGGHGRQGRSLFGLIPAVKGAIGDTPLVAAGGISTLAGFEAAVALGASGVAVGTAFYASEEAADIDAAKQKIVASTGDDTVHSQIYDIVRGPQWPAGYSGRSIRTALTDTWTGREKEIGEAERERLVAQHAAAAETGDLDVRVVWAGEGIDAITSVPPAAEIVQRFPLVLITP
jgi:nitronate monooxygenase